MTTDTPALRGKTRELHNHHMDSTRWNELELRNGDVIIATWAKAGTTWTQQIVSQLIFQGTEDVPTLDLSPWVDMRLFPWDEIRGMLEAQTHRRILKTHLPLDAIGLSPKVRYLYLARDGRDVLWSLFHHHCNFTEKFFEGINGVPNLVGPPLGPPATDDVVEYFHQWLDGESPWWPFWSHVQSWWDVRDEPNVMLVHFNELKADMPGMIRKIADFLEIDVADENWPAIIDHCTFDYMKRNATKLSERFDESVFTGGLGNFINKGTNARWQQLLSSADIEKYESIAKENLSADCAHWLATGEAH